MRTVLAAIGLICVRRAGAAHAEDTQKQKDIRKLLKITGSGELGTQVMAQMIGNMKKAMPQVPEKFWADFMKEVHTDELVDLIVPVYDRNLTHDDIKELIKFYESPTGKKFVSVLPKITQESMAVGEKWGRELAQRVMPSCRRRRHRRRSSREEVASARQLSSRVRSPRGSRPYLRISSRRCLRSICASRAAAERFILCRFIRSTMYSRSNSSTS